MDFFQRVGIVCSRIPEGKVATYGHLAYWCGKPRNARQVGRALGRGAATVAHRVVNGRGFLSGAGTFLFDGAQRDLLESEGVMVSDANTVDLQRYGWSPSFEEEQQLLDLFSELSI